MIQEASLLIGCALTASGHRQQRRRKLCLSVRTSLAKRLEEHHRHCPEWDGVHHPGAGEKTDPEAERSETGHKSETESLE